MNLDNSIIEIQKKINIQESTEYDLGVYLQKLFIKNLITQSEYDTIKYMIKN